MERGGGVLMALMVCAAMAVGALLAFQAGANRQLGDHTGIEGWFGSGLMAAMTNFCVGFAVMTVIALVVRPGVPSVNSLSTAPWWAWTGGLMGVSIVFTSLTLVRPLGAGLMVSSIVTGQLVASIVVDQFGLVGVPSRPASVGRLVGACLLIAGVVVMGLSTRGKPAESGADDGGSDGSPGSAEVGSVEVGSG